jgi:hypothetical protein
MRFMLDLNLQEVQTIFMEFSTTTLVSMPYLHHMSKMVDCLLSNNLGDSQVM